MIYYRSEKALVKKLEEVETRSLENQRQTDELNSNLEHVNMEISSMKEGTIESSSL